MDEFLKAASHKLGLHERAVSDATIELLIFVRNRSNKAEFGRLLAAVPGSAALLATKPPAPAGGQLQRAASLLGTRATGPLGATGVARRCGLDPTQIGPLVALFRAMLVQHAGKELTAAVLNSVPELDTLSA
jgi:hypothetical protein